MTEAGIVARSDAKLREDIPWTRVVAFVARQLLKHPVALTAAVILGVAIAVSEFLTIGLILPFLASISGQSGAAITGSKVAFLVPYFERFDLVTKIRLIAVGILGLQILKGGLTYASGRVAHYLRIQVERRIRELVFDQALALELRWMHRQKTSEIFTILNNYPRETAKIGTAFLTVIPKTGTLVTYLVVLFMLSWQMTLLAAGLAAATTLAMSRFTRTVKRVSQDLHEAQIEKHHLALETLSALKLVHLFAREAHARRRFGEALDTLEERQFKRGSLEALVQPLFATVSTAMFVVVIVVATLVLSDIGQDFVLLLTMFIFVLFRLMGPASTYIQRQTKIAAALPGAQGILHFLDRTGKPFLTEGSKEFAGFRDRIRYVDVRFRYDADSSDVVRGISFEIRRGTTVALVGASGAGKSTVINLLTRLYDPTGGRIEADGTDIRGFRIASWRRRIAVVSQDTHLFNDTIRENIRYGRLDATDAEVEAAARLANAASFIEAMEQGWDTRLGDRGVRLSGGQAQRVAIARAVLANPDVLVLDEATSALDTETERQVQEAIERVSRDRTVVAIAHRLSTIRRADEILVLEEGSIVERGTHASLMERGGRYAVYVNLQRMEDAPSASVGPE